MKKKVTLRLYLSDKCNLSCEYCNINYDIKGNLKEQDFFEFVDKNKENINFDLIYIFGGEPLVIYTNEFYKFLNDNFKHIIITTNFTLKTKIAEIIEILGDKAQFAVSFNSLCDDNRDNISDITNNIEVFKNNVKEFNLLLNEKTYIHLYETVKFLNQFNKTIFVLPETRKDGSEFSFDEDVLKEQLVKIFDADLQYNMFDFIKQKEIDAPEKNTYENCNGSTILISKTGDMFPCEYVSNIYKYSDTIVNLGNIRNTLIKDIDFDNTKCINQVIGPNNEKCLSDCGKCYHIECNPKYYTNNNHKIPKQICQYSKVFYDFSHKYCKPLNLEEVTIYLTETCNMRCKYCFEGEYKNQLGKVSNEIIKKAIDLLVQVDGENSRKKLGFFGGEPTLNIEGMEYALDYYLKLKEQGLKCNVIFDINTNMLNLTKEIIRVFKRFKEEANLYISVSLDGCKTINDENRIDIKGNGTYDRIIENVKTLKKELKHCPNGGLCGNITICRHSVLTNENIKYIKEICEEAWNLRDVFDEFSIQYASVGKSKKEHYVLSEDNIRYIKQVFDDINKIEDERKRKFVYDYIKGLNVDLEILMTDGYSACNAVEKLLSIRANGDILPCHAFLDKIYDSDYETKIKMGNILDYDSNFGLNEFDENFKFLDKDNKLNTAQYEMFSELGYNCAKCDFKFMCHLCFANLKEFKDNKIIRRKETCMKTLRQAKILMELQKISLDKEIEEYQNRINGNIDSLVNGLVKLQEETERNKSDIDNIKGFIDDLTKMIGDDNGDI